MCSWKLGDDDGDGGHEVDKEKGQVIVGVMSADEEEHDGHAQQELLGWSVLVTVVNLLPHVQVVVCAGVEVEGHAAHPVKHEVAAKHVRDVGQGPGCFLRHTGDDVKEDLEADDEDEVDDPGAFCVDPLRVEVGQRGLVADVLEGLRGFRVHQAGRPAPTAGLFGAHPLGMGGGQVAWMRIYLEGGSPVEEYGRQFGGGGRFGWGWCRVGDKGLEYALVDWPADGCAGRERCGSELTSGGDGGRGPGAWMGELVWGGEGVKGIRPGGEKRCWLR